MIETIVVSLAISLAFTIVLEVGFYIVVSRVRHKSMRWGTRRTGESAGSLVYQKTNFDKKDLFLVVMVNILTNPVVVMTYWLSVLYFDISYVIIIVPLEIFAVFTEGFIFKKHGRYLKHPYVFSVCINAFSFGTGLVLQYFNIF